MKMKDQTWNILNFLKYVNNTNVCSCNLKTLKSLVNNEESYKKL